jgi:tRNA (guanine37-N1)-methyltransferase
VRVAVVTLFPDLVRTFLAHGLIRRAIGAGVLEAAVVDLRDHAHDRHRTVDDVPFGGGGGMVLRPEPLFEAVESVRREGDETILLSPQGEPLTHGLAAALASRPGLVLICGRYEGVDERVRVGLVDREVSIGDYVLMGGELPALVLLEVVARHLPGVLGNARSAAEDSFAAGLLDHPHYTRPATFRGMAVPEVLTRGDHGAIARWRRREALRATMEKRPDLLARAPLDADDAAWLEALRRERGPAGAAAPRPARASWRSGSGRMES